MPIAHSVVKSLKMTPRITATLFAALLAAAGAQSAPKPNPVEAARFNNLGCAYMNQQLFEKGLKAFQDALANDPNLPNARMNEGIAYLNLQKMDEAKAALDEAAKNDPKSPYAWYNLGLLYKNTGNTQAAIDAFRRVSELVPTDADAWYFLGTVTAQAREFPQAIEAFQHALQLNPLHASAEFGLARAYQQSADADHARDHLKKFQYITEKKLGAPLSLAYGEQGQYSRAVESPSAVLKAPAQIKVQFVDVTEAAGLLPDGPSKDAKPPSNGGPGACFLDFDGDGKVDLFLADNGPGGGMALFHNLGGGHFEEVTRKAGLDPSVRAIGCTAGDYDNDGSVDLAIGAGRLLLLHNEKNGTFKDVTVAAGIATEDATGLTFVDYDHDGDLDLYVTRYNDETYPTTKIRSPYMWRNNADGTFTDVSLPTGLGMSQGMGPAAIGTDYNNDRAVDLVVTGGIGGPMIFQNPREGGFLDRRLFSMQPDATSQIQLPPHPAVAVAGLDFDHDGWMDLVFSYSTSPALVLWRNKQGKDFEQVPLPETNWVRAYGVAAFDYDNDGWVDLVAVGETKEGKGEVSLFRNLGPDGFKDVTTDVGLDKIQLKDPRAIITGDYDNDGATRLADHAESWPGGAAAQ